MLVGRHGPARFERRLRVSGLRVLVEDRFVLASSRRAEPPKVEWVAVGAAPRTPQLRSGAQARSLDVQANADWGTLTLVGDATHFERSSPSAPAIGWGASGPVIGYAGPRVLLPTSFSLRYSLGVFAHDPLGDHAAIDFWRASGEPRLDRALPQTMPFSEYARTTIPAALDEAVPGSPSGKAYFEIEVDGVKVAAASGAKPTAIGIGANPARTAWGLRWWGEFFKSQRTPWASKGDLMAGLALEALRRAGDARGAGAAFEPKTLRWIGAPTLAERAATWVHLLKYSRRYGWRRDEVESGARSETGRISRVGPFEGWMAAELARVSRPEEAEPLIALVEQARLDSSTPWAAQASAECALFLLQTGDSIPRRVAAARAAGSLARYQYAWTPPGLGAIAPFGSFTDGSLRANSAFSGSFGVTLLRLGAALGRRDVFQRGVAALRSSVANLSYPLAIDNMVFPNPGLPTGLGVPGSNFDGRDRPAPRAGFDDTEGPIFAGLAEALDEFGGAFRHREGWSEGIDGVRLAGGAVEQLLRLNPTPWTGVRPVDVVASDGSRQAGVQPTQPFAFRRIEGRTIEGRSWAVAIPAMGLFGGQARAITGSVALPDGTTRPAVVVPEGVGVQLDPTSATGGPLRFEVRIDGRRVPTASGRVWFDSNLEIGPGWHAQGDLSQPYGEWATPAGGRTIDTRGAAGREGRATGTVYSPRFSVTGRGVAFRLEGPASPNLGVVLEDAVTGAILRAANPTGQARTVRWPTVEAMGRMLRLRFVDREEKLKDGFLRAVLVR